MKDFPLSDAQVLEYADGNDAIALDNYDALYAYYTDSARGSEQMPYGTAKARTGDPDQFIHNALEQRARVIRFFTNTSHPSVREVIEDDSAREFAALKRAHFKALADTATFSNPIRYRGYRIYLSDVGFAEARFAYSHEDYDGADDANDGRAGYGRSIAEVRAEIDEREND